MRKVLFIAAACAVLAIPNATAAGIWEGELTAQSIRLEGLDQDGTGSVTNQAALHALFRFDLPEAEDAAVTTFELRATNVHVETVEADPVLVGPEGTTGTLVSTQTTPRDYTEATVLGLPARTNYLLEVMALQGRDSPRIASTSSCSTVEASDRDVAQSQPKVEPTRRHEVSVADAVLWRECGSMGRFTVQGAFLLTLWEIDAELMSGGQAVQLKSGYETSTAPGAEAAYPVVAKSRQQYLYVEDGQLELPMDASPHAAFVHGAQLDVAGHATFAQAVGALSRGGTRHDVSASTLRLEGSLRLDGLASQGRGQPLVAGVSGALDHAEADGTPLDVVATVVGPRNAGFAPWMMGLLGAAVLAVPSAVLVRRALRPRRVEQVLDRASELYARLRFAESAALAAKALSWNRDSARAHYERARSLRCLGHLDVARLHQEQACAKAGTSDLRAESALLGSLLAVDGVQRGQAAMREPAIRWLRVALLAKPSLEREVQRHAELEPILGEALRPARPPVRR